MSPRSERAQELVNYVKEEIESYRAGEINRLSSNEELKERFGYSSRSPRVSYYLSTEGLSQEKREVVEQRIRERLSPSDDLSWMVGVLSGGGHVKPGNVSLSSSTNNELLERFKLIGENLFNQNASDYNYTLRNSQRGSECEIRRIAFSNSKTTRMLGDLRKNEWANTITSNYTWILQQDNYLWSFLEGYFDVSGGIDSPNKNKRLTFFTEHLDAASLLSDFLSRVGVQHPFLYYEGKSKAKVRGVGVGNVSDLKHIAHNIRSLVPQKEEKLEYYRKLSEKDFAVPARIYSEEEVISEWIRIRGLLGRVPTTKAIDALRKEGVTKYSSVVYAKWFGSGNFNTGRRVLEEVVTQKYGHAEYKLPTRNAPIKNVPDQELVREWVRLRDALGHSPNAGELQRLKKLGQTQYSLTQYVNRFGNGSYVKARETLERMTDGQTVSDVENISSEESQVFP